MENSTQIEKIEHFLYQVVLEELEKLQQAGLTYVPFVIMGQTVEVLGGFLDQKPMKARGQSARRFAAGVKYLFGGRYRALNENNFLYDKLRNQMTHAFIPSRRLILLPGKKEGWEHLQLQGGQLVLIAEVFYQDIRQACERLIALLKSGRVKPKMIAFEDEE